MIRVAAIIFIVFTGNLYATAQTGTATVDRNRILIGEPIKWNLQLRVTGEVRSNLFLFDTIPHFEILDSSEVQQRKEGAETVVERTYTITSWDSGWWTLPPLMSKNFSTQPIRIKVDWTQPFDTAQPYHDLKDIVPVEKETQPKWYWYLIGLALLLVLFLLFFPRDKKAPVVKQKQWVDPYREAITRLEQLRAQNFEPSDVKLYYTQLVDIFRNYLHRKRNIYSFSKTTDDLSIQIKDLNLPNAYYNELVQTLQLSDMVKYAKYQPAVEENRTSFNVIRQTIIDIEKGNAV